MRAKASNILMCLLAGLLLPVAFAAPRKAHRPRSRHIVAAARTSHRGTKKAVVTERGRKRSRSKSSKTTRDREIKSLPQPRSAGTGPEVHVRHDRKQHTRAEPSPPSGETGNMRATRLRRRSPVAQLDVDSPAEAADQAVGATEAPAMLYNAGGGLIVPAALKGSREILLHQNEMADRDGLERIQDDADLQRMRGRGMLVAIPSGEGVQTDARLSANRRYCRPWTAKFVAAMGRAHYARFGRALQVNSAVRTVEFQHRLQRRNGNAAPAEGETASPHLTGQAIDFAKHGLSLTEIAWLRGYLLPLMREGKIDVEEEFQQSCFHISVYKKYLSPSTAPGILAEVRRGSGAAGMR